MLNKRDSLRAVAKKDIFCYICHKKIKKGEEYWKAYENTKFNSPLVFYVCKNCFQKLPKKEV